MSLGCKTFGQHNGQLIQVCMPLILSTDIRCKNVCLTQMRFCSTQIIHHQNIMPTQCLSTKWQTHNCVNRTLCQPNGFQLKGMAPNFFQTNCTNISIMLNHLLPFIQKSRSFATRLLWLQFTSVNIECFLHFTLLPYACW